ncbi:MAG: aminotransferase class V-fold PLP-dependent enzyme [bacterium]|nr:aminotransferase class V-fold PLP-dependent enzyme [bacterium]
MDDPLLRFRDQFPILDQTTYLISNSLGAMPLGARAGLKDYADAWQTRGVRAWSEGWWEMAVNTGDLLGPLLGTGPGEVSFHLNVTLASAVFLSALSLRGNRNKLVVVDLEFPSLQYLYNQHPDAEIVTIRTHDGISIDEDELCAAIDERTRLVAFSHVLFQSSYIMDAQRIAARAREVGATTLLDVFQSAGTMPVDLHGWGIDAAVGGCLKWLCGGPGNCYLWVRPELGDTLEPRITGWQAHPRPFEFESGPTEFRTGAWRWLTGTPNIPALHAARAGLEILTEAGMDAVREKSMRQTAKLAELFERRGWRVGASSDPVRRGGTVAVDVPHARDCATELNKRDVCVDFRPDVGIRMSPHFYTRDDELECAVDELADVLETGAWEKHAGVERTVS